MSKATVASYRIRKLVHFLPAGAECSLDYELCYPLTSPDHHRLTAEIDRDDLNLAPVIRIDRSRAVYKSQSLLQGEPAAGPNLTLESFGERNRNAGRNQ